LAIFIGQFLPEITAGFNGRLSLSCKVNLKHRLHISEGVFEALNAVVSGDFRSVTRLAFK